MRFLLFLALIAPAAEPPPDLARKVARKEAASEAERANYMYRQSVTVQEYGARGRPGGEYREVRDVIFSPLGERTERLVGEPRNSLKRLRLTEEDFADVRDVQPMMLTPERLFLYETAIKGEETVDGVACWVMRVQPRQILTGQRLFDGLFWIDQRDFSIVRSEGRAVPQIRSTQPGRENLFPYFTTVRSRIGDFWFPVLTQGDDTLDFSSGALRMRLTIRYMDYRKFGAESTVIPDSPK